MDFDDLICVNYDNMSEKWWDAARELVSRNCTPTFNKVFRKLEENLDGCEVTSRERDLFFQTAAALDGWKNGAAAPVVRYEPKRGKRGFNTTCVRKYAQEAADKGAKKLWGEAGFAFWEDGEWRVGRKIGELYDVRGVSRKSWRDALDDAILRAMTGEKVKTDADGRSVGRASSG